MFWNEELKNNMTDVQEFRDRLGLDDEKMKRMKALCKAFPMSIPRYYLSLIDWDDPEDPIRRMCIPALLETDMSGAFDTSGEAGNTVCAGVQHKYRESALILTTNRCAMYCRHCFRKRLVGLSDDEIARHFDEVAGYVREHKEITNVILSGGDTLMLPTRTVVHYLETFSRIAHLDLIRIATRMPVVYPMRITKDRSLLKALTYYGGQKQIYVVTQFNHPRELTPEARAAVRAMLLRFAGEESDGAAQGRERFPANAGPAVAGADCVRRDAILCFSVQTCKRGEKHVPAAALGRLRYSRSRKGRAERARKMSEILHVAPEGKNRDRRKVFGRRAGVQVSPGEERRGRGENVRQIDYKRYRMASG